MPTPLAHSYKKRCPACGTLAPLDKAKCSGCDRVFNIQIAVPPSDEESVALLNGWVTTQSTSPSTSRYRTAKVIGIAAATLIAVLTIGVIFTRMTAHVRYRTASSPPPTFTTHNSAGVGHVMPRTVQKTVVGGPTPAPSNADFTVRSVGEEVSVDQINNSYPLALNDPLDLDLWIRTFGQRTVGEEESEVPVDRSAQEMMISEGRIVKLYAGTKVRVDSVSSGGVAYVTVLEGQAVGRKGYMHGGTLGLR